MKCYPAHYPVRLRFLVMTIILTMPLFQNAVLAMDEPKVDEHSAVLNAEENALLFNTLANAPTQLEGQLAESAIWQLWFNQAPTAEARSLLDSAIERREAYDFEAAEALLDKLIETEPDYAEGYNQRAFIRFLRENFVASKADLEKTLTMVPNHFAAFAGLYQVHSRLGDREQALVNLASAVNLHPWLKERGGLPRSMWPKRYREIHDPGQEI